MVKVGLLARVEAKPGQEATVEAFLRSALPLAQAESDTVTWYAFKISESEFGIFDTFEGDEGRQAHLTGEIAKALMANAEALLAKSPVIEKIDILGAK